MDPCIDYCFNRFGKGYTKDCDNNCEYAKVIAENKELRADLARVTAERDAAVKKYEAEKEDFLDYAFSRTQNAAPFCTNRHPDCVDKRGWCVPVKCHGFSRDKEDEHEAADKQKS